MTKLLLRSDIEISCADTIKTLRVTLEVVLAQNSKRKGKLVAHCIGTAMHLYSSHTARMRFFI